MSSSRAKVNYDRYLAYSANTGYKLTEKPSVWVKDAAEGFLKGEVQGPEGSKLKIKFGDGSSILVNEKDTEPANPAKFDGAKDCSDLSHLNNATVLHNLRVRYAEDLIHTYSGLFLVVVNPYKWIPIYTDEIIQMYQGKRRNEVHPHVFAVADEAYRAMINGKRNQSILITGESGAGKTENTKKVIQYLATIAGKASQGGKLEEQILQANPMLEAFGNAKTNKNDNSSRFGKFIRIQFNSGGIICGTTIQVYLLEKSRVVFQGRGERSFHIFYQLLAGADSVQRKTYHLQKPNEYGFFSDQNSIVLKSMDDGAEWGQTLKAMEVIGMEEKEQDSIFRMVAGIMQCGNIKYGSSYGGEGAKLENPEVLDKIAELWGIDADVFSKSLIKPRVQAGREVVEKHLTQKEASYARDALCKSLYERAFLWIVKKLNRVLASPTESNFIGVLDIAGFEIFENNTFEQLCINYTNEKLQQFFNNHMFKLEQEEYAREKITWTYIDFGIDSVQTIDLIDKKDNSIIALLDEETIFPRASDESLIQKLHTLSKKHPKYSEVQFKKLNFQIEHYAGDVIYDVTDWITKNKDPLQNDIAKAITASKNPFFSSLFTDPDLDPRERMAQQKAAAAAAAGKKKRIETSGASFLTVASAYKDQLNDLMNTLRATEPNFIRCLIPNLQKKQQSLNAELILEQLACNGVLEGIRISRKGYPNRLRYAEFAKRYYLLHGSLKRDEADPKAATEKIMSLLEKDLEKAFAEGDHPKPLWQFGLTKIFFRHGVLAKVEETRERKLGQMVISIQSGARGWLGRSAFRKYGSQTAAARVLQKNVATWIKFRKWNWWQLFAKSKPLLNKVGIEVVMKELEERVAQLEKDLMEAKEDRDKLRKEYQNKKDHLLTLREDVNSLNGRINRLDTEKDDLTKETNSLNDQLADLESQLESISKSRSATDKDLVDAEALLAQKSAAQKKEEGLVKELQSLKEENMANLKELANKESTLEDSNSVSRNRIATEQDNLDSLTKELDGQDSQGSDLKKKVAATQADLDDANADLEAQKLERSKLNESNRSTESQIADAEDELDIARKAVASTKSAVKGLDGEKLDLDNELDRANRQITDLEKKKSRLSEELATAEEQAASEKGATDSENKKNAALSAEIEALERDLETLEATKGSLEGAKRSLGSNVSDMDSKSTGLKSQSEKLKKQLSELDNQLKAKESEFDSSDSANSAQQAQVKKLESQLREVQDELDLEREANSKRTKDNAAREEELHNLTSRIKDLEDAVAGLGNDAKKLSSDVKTSEADSDDVSKGNEDLQRKIKALQNQLAEVRGDVEAEEDSRIKAEKAQKSSQLAVQDAQAELKDMESQRSNLQSKLKAKAHEAEELASKAASDSIDKEKTVWKAEKKKAQQELDAARDKRDASESTRNRSERKLRKLKSRLAEAKAENEAAEKNKSRAPAGIDSEEETRRANQEIKQHSASLGDDERELKGIQTELEALRDLIRKAVTTTGAETIRGMDARGKTGSSASSGLPRKSSAAEVGSPFGSRRGSVRKF